jgi:hypothetical protein
VSVDRKALSRAYKQRRPPMGVYRVHDPLTGHALVAAALDLPSILNRHRAQLSMGAHPTKALQDDWAAHGSESFVFEVLDTLTPPDEPDHDPLPDLVVLEALWLEKLSLPADRRYSIDSRNRAARPSP